MRPWSPAALVPEKRPTGAQGRRFRLPGSRRDASAGLEAVVRGHIAFTLGRGRTVPARLATAHGRGARCRDTAGLRSRIREIATGRDGLVTGIDARLLAARPPVRNPVETGVLPGLAGRSTARSRTETAWNRCLQLPAALHLTSSEGLAGGPHTLGGGGRESVSASRGQREHCSGRHGQQTDLTNHPVSSWLWGQADTWPCGAEESR